MNVTVPMGFIGYDPSDAFTAFTVEGSNSSYIASFGNNTDASFLRLYTSQNSNAGYVLGTSNQSFVFGSIDDNTNYIIPDIVLTDQKVALGGLSNPEFTLDVNGDINFTGRFFHQSNELPVTTWNYSSDGSGDIYSSRWVGIGTAVPMRPLHVHQTPQGQGVTNLFNEAAFFRGSVGIMDGYNDGYRFLSALDNTMTSGSSRYITFGKAKTTNQQGELSYNHVGDGSASNYVGIGLQGATQPYAAINASGNLGVGVTFPLAKMHINGGAIVGSAFSNIPTPGSNTLLVGAKIGIGTSNPQASFHTTGDAVVSSLRAYGEIVSFSDMSDASLKENLVRITDSTQALERVTPVMFQWKRDIFFSERAGTQDVGLIAQDVEQVFPHVIGTLKDPKKEDIVYKTVKYEKLVPYLINAIQELSERLRSLESILKA